MIFFRYFFCIYCLCFYAFADQKPLVIGLGADCDTAGELRKYNIRLSSYPFDWVGTASFDSITKVIEEDFLNWMNPSFLEYKGDLIYNSYYKITMPHDFPRIQCEDCEVKGKIVANFLEFLPMVQEKYERRIKRFQNVLNSNEPVIFIRTFATPGDTKKFVKMMKKKFPQLNYKLVVLIGVNNHKNNKKNEFVYDWNIKNVQVIYCHGEDSNGSRWDSEIWKSVFLHLGLIN